MPGSGLGAFEVRTGVLADIFVANFLEVKKLNCRRTFACDVVQSTFIYKTLTPSIFPTIRPLAYLITVEVQPRHIKYPIQPKIGP